MSSGPIFPETRHLVMAAGFNLRRKKRWGKIVKGQQYQEAAD
jgi:hypothetical protein